MHLYQKDDREKPENLTIKNVALEKDSFRFRKFETFFGKG
jgi:hypothetical protein